MSTRPSCPSLCMVWASASSGCPCVPSVWKLTRTAVVRGAGSRWTTSDAPTGVRCYGGDITYQSTLGVDDVHVCHCSYASPRGLSCLTRNPFPCVSSLTLLGLLSGFSALCSGLLCGLTLVVSVPDYLSASRITVG